MHGCLDMTADPIYDSVAYGARVVSVRVISCRVLMICLLCAFSASHIRAEGAPIIKVKSEASISMQVVNVPLNEVLLILAKNVPMEVKGTVPSGELLTLEFSNLPLEEALRRIMRGYNYVLVHMDEPSRPVLTVMSRTERTPYTEAPPAPAPTPTPAAAAPSGAPEGVPRPRGSAPPGLTQPPQAQGQEPPQATGRASDTGEIQPPVPDPRAVPPAAFRGPAVTPPGAGAMPQGPVVQPGTAPQIPPEAAGPPVSSQQAPAVSRQETQIQQPEPSVIMTPFGFRTEEAAPASQAPAQVQQPPATPQPTRRFPPGMTTPGQTQ